MQPPPAIFLVDDDEDDIYLAKLTFSSHFPEWQLTSFTDGQELLDYVLDKPGVELPAIILLDLNMPRLNGHETLTALKSLPDWQRVPVAILTTSTNLSDAELSLSKGAFAFLTKPASAEQLSQLISEQLIV